MHRKEEEIPMVDTEVKVEERRKGGDRRAGRRASSSSTATRCSGAVCARSSSSRTTSRVVGEAGSGREALATVEELTPDVVLRDLGPAGPERHRDHPAAEARASAHRVIVLASNDDEDQLSTPSRPAPRVRLKDIDPTDLIAIIRASAPASTDHDKVFAKPAVASRVLKGSARWPSTAPRRSRSAPLPQREVEILDNIARA